jgi:O-antigen/teichoic acid export membrane protein
MPQKVPNIARNTSYFTLALIFQKIISFTYFLLLARALGPDDLGKYYFAISFTTIFAIFIDIGLANVLTREVAKHDEAAHYLGGVLAIKLPLALLSFLAVAAIVNISGYPQLTKNLVYLSSFCMVLDSFSATFFAFIRGFHNLFFESIGSVLFQVVVLVFGLTALKLNLGLAWQMGALVAASCFFFLYSSFLVAHKWKARIWPQFDKALTINLIKITLPFALFTIFQRFYTYFDSVLLSILAGDRDVGIYQVAFKIIFALQFLPLAFTASLYPSLSAYWVKNREQLAITFERAMSYLIIISLPISFGIIALASKIIILFKAEYADSLWPLKISIAAIPFMFLTFPIGSLLNACDRQKKNTIIMGIVTAASIILNILLIPHYRALGASLTVFISSCLGFILMLLEVPKIIRCDYNKVGKVFFKALPASIIIAGLTVYLKNFLNIFLVAAVSGIIYFALMFWWQAFKREDVVSILKSFRKS